MPITPQRERAGGRYHEVAPAKVNLFLHVLGRRDDGYHRLESLVAFADVGDEVEVDVAPVSDRIYESASVVVAGPFATTLHDELGSGGRLSVEAAYEIARAAASPRRYSVDLALVKNLPVAAGLGGGSADGAATLRALARAFALDWSERELAEAALAIGADGPVCVGGRPAMMRGIGEVVTPLEAWPDLDAVLVNPNAPVSTRAVFDAFAARGEKTSAPHAPPPATRDREIALAYLSGARNDLLSAACAVEPVIAEAHNLLQSLPGARLVRLSGSGATCWALFSTQEDAARAVGEIARTKPDWWAAATRLKGIGS